MYIKTNVVGKDREILVTDIHGNWHVVHVLPDGADLHQFAIDRAITRFFDQSSWEYIKTDGAPDSLSPTINKGE
jgi:hypothetical protein